MSALAERRWFYPLLLAVPFLVGIAALRGLTVEIETFHGSDARVYHLPTILQFRDALPGLDLDYTPGETPLFHLLFALWGEVVGFELWRLRLLNVLVSYAGVLVLFGLLVRRVGLPRGQAFALALVFELSPYVFGASFTLLTDNLAILFGLLALERFLRFREDGALATFALGCLAMGAAVMTRQSYIWLAPVAGYVLLVAAATMRRRLAGAAIAALSLVPLAAVLATWGGLVSPGAHPGPCGVCEGGQGLTLRNVAFAIAIFGVYAAALHGPGLLRRLRRLRPTAALAAPLVAGVALLVVAPLEYRPTVPGKSGGDAGYLWQISDRAPVVASSSLLFWGLVPLGALALWLLVRRSGIGSLPVVYFASFLLAAIPVAEAYQKFFDPFVLLALVLLVRPPDLRERLDYAGVAALCVAFVAYALTFSG